jgi:hypothetical protein
MHVSRRDRRGALLQSIEMRNGRAVGAWRYLTQHNDGATRLYSRRISIRVPVGAEFFLQRPDQAQAYPAAYWVCAGRCFCG